MAHSCPPATEDGIAIVVGSTPNRQHCGETSPLGRQRGMTNGVDTAMDSVKAPRSNAAADLHFREAEATQLHERDDPVLAPRDLSQTHFGLGDFPFH
ncbi:MAG: hypothetical protein ACRDLL_12220 [Solirubrobacterales bacterium]